jgi:hypothetical protein
MTRLLTPRNLFVLLASAFLVQTAHHAEHVTQMIQIYIQDMPAAEAQGLLGEQFNFEWVHFTYNVGLELAVIALGLCYYLLQKRKSLPLIGKTMPFMLVLVIWQGYHALEHIIRMVQYLTNPVYRSGQAAPPGLIPLITDWPIPLVHFWINMVVWLLMALIVWRLHLTFVMPERMLYRKQEQSVLSA